MTERPASQRKRLSLTLILDAAVRVVERDGARALTMRALGRELGVEAMALYRYVDSFDALLDAVVNRTVDTMLDDPRMHASAQEDWRAFLTKQAHGVRSIAVAQPQLFPLIATRTPSASWIRPPVRSLRWIEEFLAGLLTRGFADEGAAAAYRTFTSFLLGHLLLEVSARGVNTGPVAEPGVEPPDDGAAEDLAAYPAVLRLAGQLAQDHADEEFQASLTSLLDRMEHLNALPSPSSLG